MVKRHGAALRLLWKGRCTVYTYGYTTDEGTGVSVKRETAVVEDEPCRVSFSSSPPASDGAGANSASQTITLFISSSVDIPPGSKLVITQNGSVETYAASGRPKVYSTHQEIQLTEFRGWA